MSAWIDVAVPLRTGMTAWPGSVGLHLSRTLDLDAGDAVNNSRLDSDVHVGTHAAGAVIVEGLDLSPVAAGAYELVCLPLPLVGADGAPARTILRPR